MSTISDALPFGLRNDAAVLTALNKGSQGREPSAVRPSTHFRRSTPIVELDPTTLSDGLAALYDRYHRWLYGLLMRTLRDQEATAHALGQTLGGVMAARLTRPEQLRGAVVKAAYEACLRVGDGRGRRRSSEGPAQLLLGTMDASGDGELRRLVWRAMESLTHRERLLFELEWHDLVEERELLAIIGGRNAPTILARARERVRTTLTTAVAVWYGSERCTSLRRLVRHVGASEGRAGALRGVIERHLYGGRGEPGCATCRDSQHKYALDVLGQALPVFAIPSLLREQSIEIAASYRRSLRSGPSEQSLLGFATFGAQNRPSAPGLGAALAASTPATAAEAGLPGLSAVAHGPAGGTTAPGPGSAPAAGNTDSTAAETTWNIPAAATTAARPTGTAAATTEAAAADTGAEITAAGAGPAVTGPAGASALHAGLNGPNASADAPSEAPGADPAGADLAGADLAGADLAGADLAGADLAGADWGDESVTAASSAPQSLGATVEAAPAASGAKHGAFGASGGRTGPADEAPGPSAVAPRTSGASAAGGAGTAAHGASGAAGKFADGAPKKTGALAAGGMAASGASGASAATAPGTGVPGAGRGAADVGDGMSGPTRAHSALRGPFLPQTSRSTSSGSEPHPVLEEVTDVIPPRPLAGVPGAAGTATFATKARGSARKRQRLAAAAAAAVLAMVFSATVVTFLQAQTNDEHNADFLAVASPSVHSTVPGQAVHPTTAPPAQAGQLGPERPHYAGAADTSGGRPAPYPSPPTPGRPSGSKSPSGPPSPTKTTGTPPGQPPTVTPTRPSSPSSSEPPPNDPTDPPTTAPTTPAASRTKGPSPSKRPTAAPSTPSVPTSSGETVVVT